jgi:RimJ/RimL family protein N-acetyltransferase
LKRGFASPSDHHAAGRAAAFRVRRRGAGRSALRRSRRGASNAGIPHPYPAGAAADWIATHERDRDAGTAWSYAITQVDGDLLVGAIDLRVRPDADGNLGYWIGHPYWGRGYATLAVRALIAMAFLNLDEDLFSAVHLRRNAASGRVLEKCGLTLQRRERRPHRGGPEEEICLWSITRERWSMLRAA